MSEREKFEEKFPVPDGVYWHDGNRRYQRTADYAIRATIAHQYAWQAWQARATPALPEGMAIVPVESTEDMILAAIIAVTGRRMPFITDAEKVRAIWHAMLAAAKEKQS